MNEDLIKFLLRSPLHGFFSRTVLLITFSGRKSGKMYSAPVSCPHDGNQVTIFTHTRLWKNLKSGVPITLLSLAVLLSGCARSTPPTPIPTPQSQRIGEFLRQQDEEFAFSMLRPANWMAANEGTGRVYYPQPQDDTMRLTLNIVNLRVISNKIPGGTTDVRWTLYQQHPSLKGWTDSLMRTLYKRDVVQLEHSLNHARIYSVRTAKVGGHIRLVAYVIDQSTPFEIILNVGGEKALMEEVDQTGLMDDFITMVESFRTAP